MKASQKSTARCKANTFSNGQRVNAKSVSGNGPWLPGALLPKGEEVPKMIFKSFFRPGDGIIL